jgi:hypothetical protein
MARAVYYVYNLLVFGELNQTYPSQFHLVSRELMVENSAMTFYLVLRSDNLPSTVVFSALMAVENYRAKSL